MVAISYYDNIKDSVKDDDSGNSASFDTLKEAAEETSEDPEEKEGDDTDIEILEEGISKDAPGKTQKEKKREQRQQEDDKGSDTDTSSLPGSGGSPSSKSGSPSGSAVDQMSNGKASSKGSDGDTSSLEEKLDTIIEQNEKMIEILESFGN